MFHKEGYNLIILFFIVITIDVIMLEILIDDSLNKKINLGSENNVWVLENGMIFLKEKNQAINKAVFLRKIP